jgi:uncharacterized protein YndB with AHSA1/START domain
MMSTSELVIQPISGYRASGMQHSEEVPATVSFTRSIHADRQRLFQALTVPEFIEAWFCAPDAAKGTTEVATCFRSFQISYRQHFGVRSRFLCAYRVLRRSKIQFTWSSNGFPESKTSLVTLRLQGDFARTTLLLTHSGLSRRDYAWHCMLWEKSMDKLTRIL